MRGTVALGLLCLLCSSLTGCYSKATAYNGRLTLAYASGVEIENFVKPIAPGAKLQVVAFANGTEIELEITKATSSRPGVVAVESVAGRKIVLRGVSAGVADLEVTARDKDGNVLVDTMFFHVAAPTVHGLEHACTDEPNAAYVRGEDIDVFHGLATADRRPVIGYAYAPVRIEPAGALQLVAQPQGASLYRFRASSANARVTVRSTVDDRTLTFRVVDRGELTEASLDYGGRVIEGRSEYVVARVRLGDTPLCSQSALTKARSLTPEICKVTAKLDDEPGEDSNRDQLAVVRGLKFGVCKFEVTLPELAGGRGVVLPGETKIGRVEFPGEKTSPLAREPWRSMVLGTPDASHTGFGWLAAKVAVLVALVGWSARKKTRG